MIRQFESLMCQSEGRLEEFGRAGLEIEDVHKITIPGLVRFTLLDEVSLLITVRSETVGWLRGLNIEGVEISEHLTKPKKTKVNMASSVQAVCVE